MTRHVMHEAGLKTRSILDLDVAVTTRHEALQHILKRFSREEACYVAFANTNLLASTHNTDLLRDISTQCFVFNDGLGLNMLSRILHGAPFPENLNGTDLTAGLLSALPADTRVFAFGGRPAVAESVGQKLESRFGVRACGTSHGYLSDRELRSDLVHLINTSDAEVVLVALGNPRQERWMLENAHRLKAKLILSVGAFLDFTTGTVHRAPKLVRAAKLEWAYRLANEPRRLWRRYTLDPLRLATLAFAQLVRFRRRQA